MAEPAVIAFQTRRDEAGVVGEPWVDEDGVARHFSVSARTVRRWRAEGIPSRLIGGSRRYKIAACEQVAPRKGGAVSVRRHNAHSVIELHDPAAKKKRQLNPAGDPRARP